MTTGFTLRTFTFSDKEWEDAQAWFAEHDKECPLPDYRGAIGGGMSVIFSPTSVGHGVILRCDCGAEKDVTDYDCW